MYINNIIIVLKCTHSFPLNDTLEHILYIYINIFRRQVNNANINNATTIAHGIYIKCYDNIKIM